MAAAFIATLKDGLAQLRQPGISGQEQMDIMENMFPRLFVFNEWTQISGRGPEVEAILQASAKFEEQGKAHQFLHDFADKEERMRDAAALYLMVIDMVMSSFTQRFEAP